MGGGMATSRQAGMIVSLLDGSTRGATAPARERPAPVLSRRKDCSMLVRYSFLALFALVLSAGDAGCSGGGGDQGVPASANPGPQDPAPAAPAGPDGKPAPPK